MQNAVFQFGVETISKKIIAIWAAIQNHPTPLSLLIKCDRAIPPCAWSANQNEFARRALEDMDYANKCRPILSPRTDDFSINDDGRVFDSLAHIAALFSTADVAFGVNN